MVTRVGGARRKTRAKMTKPQRKRGKISLTAYFQQFETGQKVSLKAEPAVQSGMYFRRYHGITGTVGKRLGTCYEIRINDRGKEKQLIVHPVHLKLL